MLHSLGMELLLSEQFNMYKIDKHTEIVWDDDKATCFLFNSRKNYVKFITQNYAASLMQTDSILQQKYVMAIGLIWDLLIRKHAKKYDKLHYPNVAQTT